MTKEKESNQKNKVKKETKEAKIGQKLGIVGSEKCKKKYSSGKGRPQDRN